MLFTTFKYFMFFNVDKLKFVILFLPFISTIYIDIGFCSFPDGSIIGESSENTITTFSPEASESTVGSESSLSESSIESGSAPTETPLRKRTFWESCKDFFVEDARRLLIVGVIAAFAAWLTSMQDRPSIPR